VSLIKNKYFGVGFTLLILVIGFIFGKMEKVKTTIAEDLNSVKNERDGDIRNEWAFISPLLDCAEIGNVSNKTINEMKAKVIDFIDQQKSQGVYDAAIYFRDLNNGPWFGIKEKEKFLPASLLKVPLMLSLLKQAVGDGTLLNSRFIWQGESRNIEYFKAEKELQSNQEYTVDEALTYMIKYSDNNASNALSYIVSTDTLLASYEDLGIPLSNNTDYAISARTYSSFFRILYNSTFLNKEYSEKALRLLSETMFNKGLVAGVSSSTIKISHKFGERQIVTTGAKQLHDCGIIYYPNKPYLLCVMTRGADFDKLASFISQVSSIVYNEVDKGRGIINN
jgi:beta-lactamase class A